MNPYKTGLASVYSELAYEAPDLLDSKNSEVSAEPCLVSWMRMLPCGVYFFGVDLLEVRLLSAVLLPTLKERTIIPCKFSRDNYL
jgi:hypothetical protein